MSAVSLTELLITKWPEYYMCSLLDLLGDTTTADIIYNSQKKTPYNEVSEDEYKHAIYWWNGSDLSSIKKRDEVFAWSRSGENPTTVMVYETCSKRVIAKKENGKYFLNHLIWNICNK